LYDPKAPVIPLCGNLSIKHRRRQLLGRCHFDALFEIGFECVHLFVAMAKSFYRYLYCSGWYILAWRLKLIDAKIYEIYYLAQQ
jgi:hypothetical protein